MLQPLSIILCLAWLTGGIQWAYYLYLVMFWHTIAMQAKNLCLLAAMKHYYPSHHTERSPLVKLGFEKVNNTQEFNFKMGQFCYNKTSHIPKHASRISDLTVIAALAMYGHPVLATLWLVAHGIEEYMAAMAHEFMKNLVHEALSNIMKNSLAGTQKP